ncbi:MAG TPA: transposase [Chryseolinea sp.]
MGYSGHKHQKGEKELAIVDNHGFVVGPISVKPVNQQDTVILPETLTALVDFTHGIGIDLRGSALTLDAGFHSQDNKDIIKAHHMKPVIHPNRRNTKTPIVMARMFRWFDRDLYRLRYKVERTFGWQDTYRKLVVSYDRLPEIRKGCRLLAYSGIVSRTPIWGLHFLKLSCRRIMPTIACYCVTCQSLRPMRRPEKV